MIRSPRVNPKPESARVDSTKGAAESTTLRNRVGLSRSCRMTILQDIYIYIRVVLKITVPSWLMFILRHQEFRGIKIKWDPECGNYPYTYIYISIYVSRCIWGTQLLGIPPCGRPCFGSKSRSAMPAHSHAIHAVALRNGNSMNDHESSPFLNQDPPCTLICGYMVPNSGYSGPNRG